MLIHMRCTATQRVLLSTAYRAQHTTHLKPSSITAHWRSPPWTKHQASPVQQEALRSLPIQPMHALGPGSSTSSQPHVYAEQLRTRQVMGAKSAAIHAHVGAHPAAMCTPCDSWSHAAAGCPARHRHPHHLSPWAGWCDLPLLAKADASLAQWPAAPLPYVPPETVLTNLLTQVASWPSEPV